jgi:hypothetical protein
MAAAAILKNKITSKLPHLLADPVQILSLGLHLLREYMYEVENVIGRNPR